MWYSSGGTKSVLHTDGYENVNCLIRGNKKLIMINSSYPTEVRIITILETTKFKLTYYQS